MADWLTKQLTKTLSALLIAGLPYLAMAAPGDILFSDDFEDGTLANWTTSNGTISGVSNSAGFAGSGAFGAFTRNLAVTVTSPSFNATVPEARLRLWIRRGSDAFSEDTDPGEDFVLEYQRSDSSWGPLNTFLGGGTNGQIYDVSIVLPADARHANLAIRLRQTGGSGFDFDYWHFDNVIVDEIAVAAALDVGTCDFFEGGLGSNWTINPTSGFAGINATTALSPSNSMFLNGGIVNVESVVVDTTDITFSDLSMWIRRGADAFSEDPDFAEDLVVEYLDDVSTWVALETFSGSGSGGQIFVRSYTLPAAGRHANLQIRFRMTGGSGAPWDYWHIDDVCFEQNPDPILQVSKVSTVLFDPINGNSDPKAIPGAFVQYTVNVINQGIGAVDANSIDITDPVPENTALFVSTASGDPIVFVEGTPPSGLGILYDYAVDVSFSNQVGGGAPFIYIPVPDIQGFDPLVTGYRIELTGSMNGSSVAGDPSFDIVFRVRIE